MKLLVRDFAECGPSFKELIGKEIDCGKTAWDITNIWKEMEPHIESYEISKQKMALKYGTPSNDDKGTYNFKGKNFKEFNDQMGSILEQKIDVKFKKIKSKDIMKINKIKSEIFIDLSWMIED